MNINTKEYWDKTYLEDEGVRNYETTFEYICLDLKPNESVVEFACGKGLLGKQIQDQGNKYIGVDISEVAVKEAKKNRVNAYVSDILKNKFYFEKYDFVVATEFLEHFKNNELKIIMEKIVSIADRGIFSVPDDCLGHEEWEEHYQKFTQESLKNFLQKYYENVVVFSYRNIRFRHNNLLAFCNGVKK